MNKEEIPSICAGTFIRARRYWQGKESYQEQQKKIVLLTTHDMVAWSARKRSIFIH